MVIGLDDKFEGSLYSENWFQLTVYDKDYSVPKWLYGGVIYQIFPDRFCRGEQNKTISKDKVLHDNWLDTPVYTPNEKGKIVNNDFFGGDFKGIISKIPYLKSLGVTAIYLNPIFKAFSNHRYDTGNYMEIDPLLGTEEDFKNLISSCEKAGIKIILDGVFNHTGDDSIYFNKYGNYPSLGAYQSNKSPYYKWYDFIDYPEDYNSWWGILTLPCVNENNKDFINYITGIDGVIEHYTKLGVGGWRLDVVDELPAKFVRKIRKAVKRNCKNATIIGEVWEDASNKIAYGVRREYFQGKELDSVMNYPLKNAILNFVKSKDCALLSYTIKEQIDHYPKKVLDNLMNILSTHDTVRLITALCGADMTGKTKGEMSETVIPENLMPEAEFSVKVASLLQYTLCGVPSVYYGDEIGMQGYADPLNRRCYPWGNENHELLRWYAFLGKLRADYDAFSVGDYSEIYLKGGVVVFSRKATKSEVLVAINISGNQIALEFEGALTSLISGKKFNDRIDLYGKSFDLLVKNNKR